jgi:hypothetical protein
MSCQAKMKKSIHIHIWFVVFSMLSVVACQPQDKESHAFLEEIQARFESGINEIELSDLTDFEWSEVCFFHDDDSDQYTAYETYEKFLKIKHTRPEVQKFEKANYHLLAVFLNDNEIIKTYAYREQSLNINNRRYSIYPTDKNGNQLGKICFKNETAQLIAIPSSEYRNLGYIYIFNRKDHPDDTDFYSR